jgi:hypothetical protein
MKVLKINPRPEDGKRLRGFADIEFPNGMVIKGFRILQEPGRRPSVSSPMVAVKVPGKPPFLKSTIVLPDELKGQIDVLILTAWNTLIRQKGNVNERLDFTTPEIL